MKSPCGACKQDKRNCKGKSCVDWMGWFHTEWEKIRRSAGIDTGEEETDDAEGATDDAGHGIGG